MAVERSNVAQQDKWNVEALFNSLQNWENQLDKAKKSDKPYWPKLETFKGKLGESPETLKKALEALFQVSRELSKLYTYAHLRHDEDITHDTHKTAFDRICVLINDFTQEIAWFEPELLALSDEILETLMNSPTLADYRFHLEKVIRIKKHMLSPEKEELLAMSQRPLMTSHKAFSAINDADFKFGTVLDSKGNEKELTHALQGIYMRDQDRILRENTFKKYFGKYQDYENTLCELLNGEVQSHLFNATARKYPSCLDAALFPKNIDVDVYHSLIKAVNDNLPILHDYIALREQVLKIKPLHPYDMHVPLTAAIDIRMPYKEAEEVVIESVAPLGHEYQNTLRQGLKDGRWVDRFENKNKRSGAYSSGCYDSMPYILMNYKDLLRDVFTLAHEAGHSMHSFLSHKFQPYHYSDYSIFLAEVASTFNEELLTQLLLTRAKSKEERIFLLNQKIDDIRATLFRQAMFAEFELFIHQQAEKNIPLTPKLLKEEYRKLNERYFGPSVTLDSQIETEWSRIPHFYYNFYVFQYATGISAALALAERVTKGGEAERDAYLSFLKGGSSRYPIDMLQMAGVDMRSPAPVVSAIKKFGSLVQELRKELA